MLLTETLAMGYSVILQSCHLDFTYISYGSTILLPAWSKTQLAWVLSSVIETMFVVVTFAS